MKKTTLRQAALKLALAALVLLSPFGLRAQNLADYTVTTSTETYTSIADATLLLSSVNGDGGTQTVTLPFNFPFGENTYPAGTTLTVRADGYVYFGSTNPGHSSKGAWTNTTTNYCLIAPFLNYDGKITANGATSGAYCTTDDPDNPTMLIIEFKGLQCYYSSYGDYNFQLRLHSNGNISTVYGESTLSTYSSASQNFFLNAKADKICLTGSYAEPVAGTPTELPNFTTAPAAGQVITFVRPVVSCPKPSDLSATADGQDVTITWTSDATSFDLNYNTTGNTTDLDIDNLRVLQDGSANYTHNGNTHIFTIQNMPLGDYYFWVWANCGTTDQSNPTGPASVHIGYCNPAPTSVDGSGITNVTFGTGENMVNNNTHPSASPYYGDYSTQIGAVHAGVESTVSITFNTCGYSCYNYGTVIWVDLNNNMSFEDDEIVFAGQSASESNPSGEHTLNAAFTIPATQALGNYRMRIGAADSYFDTYISSGSGNHNPCYTGTYTIFEDYTLRVLEAPSCLNPTALTLSRSGDQITATWDGTATDYNIDINGTVTNNVTSPYVFNAELSTTYTVKVQANCAGNETSEWTNTQSITTPACWSGRTIEYTLNDAYGDGWNGASITFIDGCEETALTLSSGSSTSGTINSCADYISFIWNSGNYDDECSFTFTEGGSTLFSGNGNSYSDGAVIYTIGTQTCPKPTNLDNETPGARSVDLTWTENGTAEAWQLCVNDDEDNLVDVTAADLNNGLYTLGHLEPVTDYAVKVRANCGGGDYSCWSEENSFITDVACPKPTNANVGTPAPNQVQLSWTKNGDETAWQLRVNGDETHLIDVTNADVTIENTTVTYTLTNLDASTAYTVVVRANCGDEDGQSDWLSFDGFTTAASCPTPVLETSGITGITGHTANVAWNGFSENDSYKVWYRVKEHIDGLVENFDVNSIPTGWERKSGLLSDVMAGIATLSTTSSGWSFGTGNGVFNSHARTEIYSTARKHWLISPSTTLSTDAALNFDLALTYWTGTLGTPATTGTDDKFVVLITTDDGATWTILRQWDNEDGSTYVYNNITCSETGEHVSIDLSAYNGETVKVAFYGESTTSNADNYLHIDNVTMGTLVPAGTEQHKDVTAPETSTILDNLDPETPYEVYVTGHCATGDVTTDPSATQTFTTDVPCMAPTNLQAYEIATDNVKLRWREPAHASEFQICINGDETNLRTVTTSEYSATAYPGVPGADIYNVNLGNLTSGTTYTVKVRSNCGGTDGVSEWSNEIQFSTECEARTANGYTEYFDTYTSTSGYLPNCWRRINEGTSYTSYPYVSSSNSNSSPNTLYFYNYGSSSSTNISDQYAVLPEMTGLAGMRVTMQVRGYSTSSTFKVGTMSDNTDASTFTEIVNTNNPAVSTSYQQFTFDVPSNSTDRYVAIMMPKPTSTSSSTYGVYIDDISIAPIPSCDVPSFTVTEWNAHAGKLNITAGASNETAWDLYFSTENTDPDDVTTPSVSNTTNATPWIGEDALTAATTYYVWVRAHCSETEHSDWYGPESFTTDCEAITITDVYSYEQNFNSPVVTSAYNSTTNLVTPVCWENPYTTGSSQAGKPHIIAAGGQYNYSTDQVLNFYGSGNNYITLPAFTNAISDLQISFKWATETNSSDKKLTLGYITAADDGNYSSFTQIVDPFITSSTSSESYRSLKSETVYLNNVPAEATRLVFRWYSSNQYSCNVDDVVVSLAPSCFPVGTLAPATNITSTTAELSWALVDNTQNAWQVAYKADADANFTTVPDVATVHENYPLNGLTPSTYYTVKVRAHCGGDDYGDWSNEISFTTLDACPVPTNVNATNITNSSATITWNDNDEATVMYRTAAVPTSNVLFPENFDSYANEAALEAVWTVTDLGDGENTDELGLFTVSDNQVFRFSSYNGSSSGSFDQYLVSPELTTIGVLEFTYKASSGSAESFRVGYSTTTNDLSEFTWGDVTNGTTTLQTYSEAMPEGAKYFAINYTAVYKHRLYIDDIAIYETAPAGEWQTAASADLSGLTANTKYDVKVVPDCDETLESATVQFTTKAAFPMHIDANKWYAIASPVHYDGNNQPLTAINNIGNAAYDLYGYNEANGTWVKEETSLTRGKGYIYRSAVATDLEFVGDYNTGAVSGPSLTTSCSDDNLKGFNLVGNPYNHPIYKGVAFGVPGYWSNSFNEGWYELMPNGNWYAHTDNDAIAEGQAVLVSINTSTTASFTDNANAPSASKAAPAATLAFTVSNGDYEDIAYATLTYGDGLPKIGHLTAEAPALSIPVADKKYAIAMVGDDAESFNLVFRGVNGTYTIKQSSNQAIAYCHLIDRATGKDIDLLSQSYTFSATGNDADRFMVKLSPDAAENAASQFAYWNGNNWVVEGDGELQVYDMLGRRIASHEVNSQLSLRNSQFPSTGVYVLRMGEKSQKIVVR